MKRPIYVIVHLMCLEWKLDSGEDNPIFRGVWNELQRILDEEDLIMVSLCLSRDRTAHISWEGLNDPRKSPTE